MKKLVISIGILIGISIINNVVMLKLHPMEYYYTFHGMLLSASICLLEIPLVWKPIKNVLKNLMPE